MSDCIKTERLTLRPYRAEDAERVAELIGDIDVARWLTRVPYPYRIADADGFIARFLAGNDCCYAIAQSDQLMGGISMKGELGYWLGKPFWGHGFATEAARAIIARHHDPSDGTVKSGHIVGNAASRRVLSKLGFENTHIETVTSAALHQDVQVQKMVLSVEGATA